MHRVALGPRRVKAVAENDGEWRKDGKRSQLVEHACVKGLDACTFLAAAE